MPRELTDEDLARLLNDYGNLKVKNIILERLLSEAEAKLAQGSQPKAEAEEAAQEVPQDR